MSQRPPERLSDFARRILRREAESGGHANEMVVGFERACRALHEGLAPLISSSGVHTLLARALKLAARDSPLLASASVSFNGDCKLSGLVATTGTPDSDEVSDALSAVLAHFMWLLVTFIGENLGVGKVREIWPEVPLDSVNPSSGAGK